MRDEAAECRGTSDAARRRSRTAVKGGKPTFAVGANSKLDAAKAVLSWRSTDTNTNSESRRLWSKLWLQFASRIIVFGFGFGSRTTTFARGHLSLHDQEMAPAIIFLMHGRVNRGARPEIFRDCPTGTLVWVQRKVDHFATAAGAFEAGPFLDTTALNQSKLSIRERGSIW
jgi:hypothetical protein